MQLQGRCHALFAFDAGREIDPQRAERRLTSTAQRKPFRHKHRVPGESLRLAAPLRLTLPREAEAVGTWRTDEEVDVSLYDFGAICVEWTIPLQASLEELVGLSTTLYDNEALITRSREICAGMLELLEDAVRQPRLADEVEDYVVFHVRPTDGAPRFWRDAEHDVARLLRAEQGRLSAQEVANAVENPVSYAEDEVCLVDWLAALLVGEDMTDELQVLELATVELLELRFLDAQLDAGIDAAYPALGRSRLGSGILGPRGVDLERIARLQADNAAVHEAFDNALKLLGDDYLARLYRTSAERFHFPEWDASIQRKLDVLDSIYGKLADHAGRRRAEVLEWIIIVLIAFEVAMTLGGR
jgi:hypothetical protein